MLGIKQYDQKVSELVNQYAGKLIKVIRSEEPDVYALGTVEFAPVYEPLLRKEQSRWSVRMEIPIFTM